MNTVRTTRLAIPWVMLLATACATSAPAELSRAAGDGEDVTLVIENRRFNEATIYAHWLAATRVLVGRVPGNTTETFRLEWRGGELRIEADFLAGGESLSRPISVSRGDRLELLLQP